MSCSKQNTFRSSGLVLPINVGLQVSAACVAMFQVHAFAVGLRLEMTNQKCLRMPARLSAIRGEKRLG